MLSLSVNIIDTYNSKTLGIADSSSYDNSPVNNPTVEITPPGFGKKALLFTPKGINLYNSNNLGITSAKNLSELISLPDGLYRIRYSVFPNSTAFYETVHLRTQHLKGILYNRYISYLSDEKKSGTLKKMLEDACLLLNGAMLAAADETTAINLYRKAEKLLRTDQCECCNLNS